MFSIQQIQALLGLDDNMTLNNTVPAPLKHLSNQTHFNPTLFSLYLDDISWSYGQNTLPVSVLKKQTYRSWLADQVEHLKSLLFLKNGKKRKINTFDQISERGLLLEEELLIVIMEEQEDLVAQKPVVDLTD